MPNAARHFYVMRQSGGSLCLPHLRSTPCARAPTSHQMNVPDMADCAGVSRVPSDSYTFIVLCLCIYNAHRRVTIREISVTSSGIGNTHFN